MNKRQFLKLTAAMGASIIVSPDFYGELPAIPKTYIYKNTGACGLKADVYGSDARPKSQSFCGFTVEV